MPNYPQERITESRTFGRIGLDYLGPITVKIQLEKAKRWIALFTCFTTRAVHLEMVDDLSAEREVVLLDEPHAPRGTWKLARIKKLNVANDGYVRSAQIETSSGKLLNRPVSTLYPLEVTPEEQSTPENPANPSERAEPIIQNRNTTTNTKISSESGEEQPIAHRTRSQTNLQKREKSNFVLTNLLLTVAISIILQAAETKECKWTSGVENHNVLSYKPQIYPLEHFSLFPRECREQARNSTRNNLCTEQSNLAKGQI
ncbi:hypothetical protein QQG55_55555 [Brugia pahangi]